MRIKVKLTIQKEVRLLHAILAVTVECAVFVHVHTHTQAKVGAQGYVTLVLK